MSHHACKEQLEKLGGEAPCCGCTGHECEPDDMDHEIPAWIRELHEIVPLYPCEDEVERGRKIKLRVQLGAFIKRLLSEAEANQTRFLLFDIFERSLEGGLRNLTPSDSPVSWEKIHANIMGVILECPDVKKHIKAQI